MCSLIVRVSVVLRRTVVGNNSPSQDYTHADDQTTLLNIYDILQRL